jgi:hypothetical protein
MKRPRSFVDRDLDARVQRVEKDRQDRAHRAQCGLIVRRYARPMPGHPKPMYCIPTQAERDGLVDRLPGSSQKDKVIFDTREAASACARALLEVGGVPQRPYACPRHRPSRPPHWHLTSDGQEARQLKNRQLRDREAS